MKMKKGMIYGLLSISIGYLVYNYLFTDYRYGMMMNHHYVYYDDYSRILYYLNSGLIFIAYTGIIIAIIILLSQRTLPRNNISTILDERLKKGEISIEEYKKIKSVINS